MLEKETHGHAKNAILAFWIVAMNLGSSTRRFVNIVSLHRLREALKIAYESVSKPFWGSRHMVC
jgi:hypothetical protein